MDPANGHRCNPAKLLLDPYAKAIDGRVAWGQPFSCTASTRASPRNEEDKRTVCAQERDHQPHFDWVGDRRLQLPWHETVIYETHVKGLTARHPEVPDELRGTYAGMAQPAVIDYLKQLEITAVELMPVHQFVHDKHLADRDLRNYWGYNSIGYFAPHHPYAAGKRPGAAVPEFNTS